MRTGTVNYWVGSNAILSVRTDGSDDYHQLCKSKGAIKCFPQWESHQNYFCKVWFNLTMVSEMILMFMFLSNETKIA